MDLHKKALDSMFGDMDDMESKKMFGEPDGDEKGVSITISVVPNGAESPEEESKEGEMPGMNKGSMMPMAEGGEVKEPEQQTDFGLPPFLRKKKKV